LTILAVVFLLGVTPLLAAPVIPRGVDTFTTLGNGKTFYSFERNPIPAGFFCKRSAAFTGKIVFRGVPLATDDAANLHQADSVIERLDDASFDENGVATTRLRFKALSLASVRPIQTACGAFHVYVALADQQRTTTMRIERTSEKGGTFSGPLAVDARMTFVPVRGAKRNAGRNLQLVGAFTFPSQPIPWLHEAGPRTKRLTYGRVDTNGDQVPDTVVAGTSNFQPGWKPTDLFEVKYGGSCVRDVCEPESCHTDPTTGEQHCSGPVYTCCGCYCP
jgi:hypothetical protein